MAEDGEIESFEKNRLIEWMERVVKKLTMKYTEVWKGVEEAMGGVIIETEVDRWLDKGEKIGRKQGIKIGEKKGRISEFIALRREDGYSTEQIIEGAMKRFGIERETAEEYLAAPEITTAGV